MLSFAIYLFYRFKGSKVIFSLTVAVSLPTFFLLIRWICGNTTTPLKSAKCHGDFRRHEKKNRLKRPGGVRDSTRCAAFVNGTPIRIDRRLVPAAVQFQLHRNCASTRTFATVSNRCLHWLGSIKHVLRSSHFFIYF